MKLFIYKQDGVTTDEWRIYCKEVDRIRETKQMYVCDIGVIPFIYLKRIPKNEVDTDHINSYGTFIFTNEDFEKAKKLFVAYHERILKQTSERHNLHLACLSSIKNQKEVIKIEG